MFPGQRDAALFVPNESIELYRNASIWKDFGVILPLDAKADVNNIIIEKDGLRYKITPVGNARIVGYTFSDAKQLVIPSSINYNGKDYPVTTIEQHAFKNAPLMSVTISEGITTINDYAFYGSSVKSVDFPNSLRKIGNCAFMKTQIEELSLPRNIEKIGGSAFADCNRLNKVLILKCNTKISETFRGCTSLKEAFIVDVPYVELAFNQCDAIEKIVLSDKVQLFYEISEKPHLKEMICFRTGETYEDLPSYYKWYFYDDDGNEIAYSLYNASFFSNYQADGVLYVPAESIELYKSVETWQNWGTILPIIPIESMQLINISIEKSSEASISIKTFPDNATDGQIFYSSSNPKIASITLDGIISAIEIGEVTITAETLDGKIATCTVTVTGPQSQYTIYNGNGTPETRAYESIEDIQVDFATYPNTLVYVDANTTSETLPANFVGKNENGEWYANAINLLDGETVYVPENVNVAQMSYARDYTHTKWDVLYIPFAMNNEDWKGNFEVASVNSVIQLDDDLDGQVDRTAVYVLRIKSGTLLPNTPYMIMAQTAGDQDIVLKDVTLYPTAENSISCSTMLSNFTFKGTYNAKDVSALSNGSNYQMTDGIFNEMKSGDSLNPFRWYMNSVARDPLYIQAGTRAAGEIIVKVIGEQDGEETHLFEDESTSGLTFDLNGRVINDTEFNSGVYIKNRKKVLIK